MTALSLRRAGPGERPAVRRLVQLHGELFVQHLETRAIGRGGAAAGAAFRRRLSA